MAEDMSKLISTVQNILHNSNSNNDNSQKNDLSSDNSDHKNDINNQPNLNISPEMINNIANMLKNSNGSTNFNNSNDKSNEQPNSERSQNNSSTIDFETIMKIKSMMDNMNKKDDPRANLLYSLKPYLRDSRKQKLDQYVNMLKITNLTDFFNFNKGDKS